MPYLLRRPKGRVALFVDGINFYYTLRELNLHVDFRRLLDFVSQDGIFMRANYYTTLLDNGRSPEWLVRLTDWLSYNKYHVTTKNARIFRRRAIDEEGLEYWVSEIKGDTDIELAVDMFRVAQMCDTIYLCSGDEAFVRLIRAVQQNGCQVIVIGSETAQENRVSDALRRQADEFLELATIASEVCREEIGG